MKNKFFLTYSLFAAVIVASVAFVANAQDFGSISGTVIWGSEVPMYDRLFTSTFDIRLVGNSTGTDVTVFARCSNGNCSYDSGFILPPDTYTASIFLSVGGVLNGPLFTSQVTTVGPGQSATANFDLLAFTGLVKGSLSVNGDLSRGKVQFCSPSGSCPTPATGTSFNSSNGPWITFDNPGQLGFKVPLLSGNYRAHVITWDNTDVGIVPITVTIGQITDGPSLQFHLDLGSISGTIAWNSEVPMYDRLFVSTFDIKLAGANTGTNITIFAGCSNSVCSYNSGYILPPDTYTAEIRLNVGGISNGPLLGTQIVSVGPGEVSTLNFDLYSTSGLVNGSLSINGSPSRGKVQFCYSNSSCPTPSTGTSFNSVNGPWITFDNPGQLGFKVPLLPGSYYAHIITWDNTNVGIVPIAVNSSQVINDQALNFQLNSGSISGTITWNGGAPMYDRLFATMFDIKLIGQTTSTIITSSAGCSNSVCSYNSGYILPPDTYTAEIRLNVGGISNGPLLGTQTIVLSSGQSTEGNFDLFQTTGLVEGSLSINGSPSRGKVQFCYSNSSCPTPSTGTSFASSNGPWIAFDNPGQLGFKVPLLPGNYFAHVITWDNTNVGTVSVAVAAGQITNIGSVTFSPVITTSHLPDATADINYSQILGVTNGVAPFNWSISLGGLPIGLSLDNSAGEISGTPTEPGAYNFTVQVTDANNQSATKEFTLVVTSPLVITTSSAPDGTSGANYSLHLGGEGGSGGGGAYSWSLTAGNLPLGLSFNSSTGEIAGIPTEPGTYDFTVQLSDSSGASTTQELTIVVNPSPAVTTVSLPDATANIAYTQTLTATGGTAPLTWSLLSGTLPIGLSLNSNGTISGTPTVATIYTFTVQVTDAYGVSASQDLTIQVHPALHITTTNLPNAKIGRNYSKSVHAGGGTNPLTWSIVSGSLPAGLSIDSSSGTMFGVPTIVGTLNFTVKVIDTNGAISTQVLGIQVN